VAAGGAFGQVGHRPGCLTTAPPAAALDHPSPDVQPSQDNKKVVYVVRDDKGHRTPVQTRQSNDRKVMLVCQLARVLRARWQP
jgi:hypothetical protein